MWDLQAKREHQVHKIQDGEVYEFHDAGDIGD